MRLTFVFLVLASLFFTIGCKKEEKRTPSGYPYIVHKNTGGAKPKPGEYVYFHAQIRTADSVMSGSRMTGAAPFLQIPTEAAPQPEPNPSPIAEVLRDMAVGDSVTIIMNIDTVPNKPPGFENVKELYYDVVAISFKSADQFVKDQEVEQQKLEGERVKMQAREQEVAAAMTKIAGQYKSGALNSQLKTTGSGLKYLVLEQGSGKKPTSGQQITVNYYGTLTTGQMFDNSYMRGTPFNFAVGKGMVIPGWDEGLMLFNEGGKGYLFIPSALGYGEAGSPPTIPPNSELIFYVELDKVN